VVRGQERLGEKILAAGMPGVRDQTHLLRHIAVGRLALHRAAGVVRGPPHSDR